MKKITSIFLSVLMVLPMCVLSIIASPPAQSVTPVTDDTGFLSPTAKLLSIETEDLGNGWSVEHAIYEDNSIETTRSGSKISGGASVDTWKRGNTVVFKIYINAFFEYDGHEVHCVRDRCELWYISYVYSEPMFEIPTKPEFIEVDPYNKVHYGCGYEIYVNGARLGYGYNSVSCDVNGERDMFNYTYKCLF